MPEKTVEEVLEKGLKSVGETVQGVKNNVQEVSVKVEDVTKRLETLEKATADGGIDLPGVEHEDFSFAKFFYALGQRDHSMLTEENGAKELDIAKETVRKAQSMGIDTSGGYMVPVQVLDRLFIEKLRDNLVLKDLGVRLLSDLTGKEVEIGSHTDSATAYWVAEHQSITDSSVALGQRSMTPKYVASLSKLSNRLLANASASIEQMIIDDITEQLARAAELAVIEGVGPNRPSGLVLNSEVNTFAKGTNGGVLTFDDIDEMVAKIRDNNAETGELAMLSNHRVFLRLRQLKIENYSGQTSSQPYLLGVPRITDAAFQEAIGLKFKHTNWLSSNLAKGSGTNLTYAIVGVWKELIMGIWKNIRFDTSAQAGEAFQRDQTWIRAVMGVGSMVRRPKSFTVCSDAQAG